jgi:hypothetical protein
MFEETRAELGLQGGCKREQQDFRGCQRPRSGARRAALRATQRSLWLSSSRLPLKYSLGEQPSLR